MNDQTIWEIVYLFWVIVAFGLVWARLVWAIRRGDVWEETSKFNRLHWQALDRQMAALWEALQDTKEERDNLLDNIDAFEAAEEEAGAIDGLEI